MSRRITGLIITLAMFFSFAISASAAGAPSGIAGNGTGGIYIDINSAPYTTYASYDYGEYAYNKGGCAWFASARTYQLTGKDCNIWSGVNWYNNGEGRLGFKTGTTIAAKALACYTNHVSVIESVSGNTVVVSESGYSDADHGYCIIHTKTVSEVEGPESGTRGDFIGYVYLGVSGSSDSTDTTTYSAGYYKVNSNSDTLNIRSGAGTSYSVIGSLDDGTTVYVSEVSGSWGKITYNGTTGWISLSHCTSTTQPATFAFGSSSYTVNINSTKSIGDTLNSFGSVSYTSSDSSKVSVDNKGNITGVSAGSANITATCGGKSTSCNVTATFTDVNNSSTYYYAPVYWGVSKGVVAGTSKTTFSPSEHATRAQVIMQLWRCAGSPIVNNTSIKFSDVKDSSYYHDAVAWAITEGITTGTSSSTFSPGKECTRAEAMTFLWRANGSPLVNSGVSFADVGSSSYYYYAVSWAVSNGITSGTGSNKFSPKSISTRAQIVTFLYKLYN